MARPCLASSAHVCHPKPSQALWSPARPSNEGIGIPFVALIESHSECGLAPQLTCRAFVSDEMLRDAERAQSAAALLPHCIVSSPVRSVCAARIGLGRRTRFGGSVDRARQGSSARSCKVWARRLGIGRTTQSTMTSRCKCDHGSTSRCAARTAQRAEGMAVRHRRIRPLLVARE